MVSLFSAKQASVQAVPSASTVEKAISGDHASGTASSASGAVSGVSAAASVTVSGAVAGASGALVLLHPAARSRIARAAAAVFKY